MAAELPGDTSETTTRTTGGVPAPDPIEMPGNVESSPPGTAADAQLIAYTTPLSVGAQLNGPSTPEPITPVPDVVAQLTPLQISDPITPLPQSDTEETIELTLQQQKVLRYIARRHMRNIRISKRQHSGNSASEAIDENSQGVSHLKTQPLTGITHLKTQPLQTRFTPIPAPSVPASIPDPIPTPQVPTVFPTTPEPASLIPNPHHNG